MIPRALAIAVLASGPSPARLPGTPAAPAARPPYYDRRIEHEDLRDRSVEELRLMRNTIYARAGRELKDPQLRTHFAKQPWYRPSVTPAKLSTLDEKNLANIKNWGAAGQDAGGSPQYGAGVESERRGLPADRMPRRLEGQADPGGVLRRQRAGVPRMNRHPTRHA